MPSPEPPPRDPADPAAPPGELLDVGDGHRLWWRSEGGGAGPAVLVLHGGPGGRTRAEPLQWLAGAAPGPVIAFDQRGCGRSTPPGALHANTTAHLVADIERLRRRLGLAHWALMAGSWGAVPALAYAAAHPRRVSGLFLRSPFLAGAGEVARFFAPWAAWLGEAGREELGAGASRPPFEVFHGMTGALKPGTGFSPGADLQRWARAWALFESDQSAPGGVAGDPGRRFAPERLGPLPDEAALAACAIQSHYLARGCFLPPRWWRAAVAAVATAGRGRARGPVSVVHGAADAVCDPRRARWLARRLGAARHVEVPGGGHRMGQEPLAAVLREEARAWAGRLGAVLLALACTFGSPGSAQAAGSVREPAASCPGPALPWQALAPRVWMVPGEGGEPGPGNDGRVANLVVVREGARVWLVGSGPTPAVGAALACEVRRRTGRPVSDVINPRAQPELVLGNAAFPGVRIWAAQPVAEAMARHCPSCVKALAGQIGPAGAGLDAGAVRLPTRRLQGEAGRLGPFDWRLLPRGGRSPTLVLHHRASGLWIAHGLLWAGAVPQLRDAALRPMIGSTRVLLDLAGPHGTVLGEQGPPAGAAALREQLAYWEALDAAVRQAVEAGALESQAGEALALPAFAALAAYGERHPLNVQRAWRQAEQAWLDEPAE